MSDRIPKVYERSISHSAVVPGSRVVRSAEVAHVGGRHELHNSNPTIELVTEGNIVRAIDVTCPCGQKVRVWCSYEDQADDRESAEAA
jgi:hypothetical protein